MLVHSERSGAEISAEQKAQLGDVYRRLSGFSATLIDLRERFDGDMDCFLIYLIVLLDDLSSASRRQQRAEVGVSALSIGEITGIPRETVRRKIATMVDGGMLRREHGCQYHVANDEGMAIINSGPLALLASMVSH